MQSHRVPVAAVPTAPVPSIASTQRALAGSVAVMVLVDLRSAARWWGFGRLVRGPRALARSPGLVFAKVLGCGAGGGFGLRPSGTHQGLFAVFTDDTSADAFLAAAPFDAYRAHAREIFSVKLAPISSRGSWAGAQPLAVHASFPIAGPIAALTRASIRSLRALRFWRDAPGAERSLANAAGCLVAAGLGEAPLLRQATFSIWESVAAMDGYARSGAHLEAIRHARAGQFFSEDLFARFVPYAARGSWRGRHFGPNDTIGAELPIVAGCR